MASHSCPEGKEIEDVLLREDGKSILFPSLPFKAGPEFAEDITEQHAFRHTQSRPVDSRCVVFSPRRFRPPVPCRSWNRRRPSSLFTGTGHTCSVSQLFCSGLIEFSPHQDRPETASDKKRGSPLVLSEHHKVYGCTAGFTHHPPHGEGVLFNCRKQPSPRWDGACYMSTVKESRTCNQAYAAGDRA